MGRCKSGIVGVNFYSLQYEEIQRKNFISTESNTLIYIASVPFGGVLERWTTYSPLAMKANVFDYVEIKLFLWIFLILQ